jgi:hypothetical protein
LKQKIGIANEPSTQNKCRWALLMNLILLCFCGNAQTNALQGASATPSPAAEHQDKSGTNPLVLRYTVQIFNEYYNLPGRGPFNNINEVSLRPSVRKEPCLDQGGFAAQCDEHVDWIFVWRN